MLYKNNKTENFMNDSLSKMKRKRNITLRLCFVFRYTYSILLPDHEETVFNEYMSINLKKSGFLFQTD
jgi:hypothetical protein